MATRLSQKAVTDEFYEQCINAGVPCRPKHGANQGYFLMQGSYGGIQVQYVYKCGGLSNISSGFVGAREMYLWLSNFDPKSAYKTYKKYEAQICKSKEERRARESGK
jgi:hypothetical protein